MRIHIINQVGDADGDAAGHRKNPDRERQKPSMNPQTDQQERAQKQHGRDAMRRKPGRNRGRDSNGRANDGLAERDGRAAPATANHGEFHRAMAR